MRDISEEKIEQILEGNAESLNLEFKGEFNFEENTWARERLIRSVLALSNTRSGGVILIGVEESPEKIFVRKGISDAYLSIFRSKAEDLKSKIESFSSGPVNYEIGVGLYREKKFVLITVEEFRLNPIICRKTGEHSDRILEEGAIYIRTLKDKPSSIKLINSVDIQDFLERSSDKQISNLHTRGWKHDTESKTTGSSLFEKERKGF